MKLIDTNVFIYAAGRPNVYKASCTRVLDLLASGEIEGNIDTEVIQEVMYNLWSRKLWREAVEAAERLLDGFATAFPITVTTMKGAKDIFASSPAIGPRDAIHAAVTLENDLEGIISTDGDFNDIAGVTRFDPMEF